MFLLFLTFSGCAKESEEIIPNTYVNFTIRLDDPQFIGLNSVGSAVIVTSSYDGSNSAGYDNNGIIIYRASQDEFYAFDRTCTFDVELSIAIEIEDSGITAVCPECSSRYVFPNLGFPTEEGPSKNPLRRYNTHFDGTSVHVYN
ncbi:MAG: hypothetical protein JSV24_01005 [Bacteroidales bacterium]|nr:MAG: hypothetical protein JSV24_01005 [Bacteroidales bacterium]